MDVPSSEKNVNSSFWSLRLPLGMSTGRGMCGGSFPVFRLEVPAEEFLPPSPSPRGNI
ncbi:hypothetical protein A2U01_0100472, partial [Trifolium medium]|nr:hypothetical protein [Trifolium medium]